MITLRKSCQRGHADHGWLESYHSFSFADYVDPEQMGFSNLRVINEDRVAPGTGFGPHGHRDMEILSLVLEGELAHRDSLGHAGVIAAGEVQRMSAGHGVRHSETNPSRERAVHFLQIWIEPSVPGGEPGYEHKAFAPADKRGRLCRIASPDGSAGSVTIHADASLYAGCFDGDERAELCLQPHRRAYVHLARGALCVNGHALQAGDALRVEGEHALQLSRGSRAEVLVFDLA